MAKLSFFETLVRTLSVDKNITDGVFDIYNTQHIVILQEYLEKIAPEMVSDIDETIERIIREAGKFPERQAYNKDGWLVTFPSIDYKRKAIARGTHFDTDPTHGRGGMNLYYRKKGKQARQTAQAVSSVGGDASALPVSNAPQHPAVKPQPPTPAKVKDEPVLQQNPAEQPANAASGDNAHAKPQVKTPDSPAPAGAESPKEPTTASSDLSHDNDSNAQHSQSEPAPSAEAEPVASVAPISPMHDIAAKTRQFAIDKGWTEEKYGNWYDQTGTLVAITSTISNEVIPVETNHREEILAKVKMPD